ncbi:MAG: choice-of-anchor J domain-containing protein [Prevotellaceae bacterium]|nr:choice-of-anchor J domain-containing protein [Prevotellaceae bacterium]
MKRTLTLTLVTLVVTTALANTSLRYNRSESQRQATTETTGSDISEAVKGKRMPKILQNNDVNAKPAIKKTKSETKTSGIKKTSKKSDVTTNGATYTLYGKSMFNDEGDNVFGQGGYDVKYSVYLNFNEQNGEVGINNLINLGTNSSDFNAQYDDANNLITINSPKELTDKADYTIIGTYNGYDEYLMAVKPYGIGYVEEIEDLKMEVSDNKTRILPQSGMAAVDFYSNSNYVRGYTDIIYDAVLFKNMTGIKLMSDSSNIHFDRTYSNLSYTKSFSIYNIGTESTDYIVSCEGDGFSIDTPTGMLSSGDKKEITVTFTPTSTGEFTGKITVSSEGDDITINLYATCNANPEYSSIVKEGDFNFGVTGSYPWIIDTEKTGSPVAISSNTDMENTTSVLYATCSIPEHTKGTLSWKGYYSPYFYSSDEFIIYANGVNIYEANIHSGDISDEVVLPAGEYTIEFTYDKGPKIEGMFTPGEDYTYIYDLSLVCEDIDANKATLSTQEIDFSKMFIEDNVSKEATVSFKNEGYEDLYVKEISGTNGFSGIVPDWKIGTFESGDVTITFTTDEAGEYEGNVVISTSAGDFTIACHATVIQMPDFTKIVKNGEFSFDTDADYPFIVEGNTAYNSTSKVIDEDMTLASFTATFTVPEGTYGALTWNGTNSASPLEYYGFGDGGIIEIDGGTDYVYYDGESDASYTTFSPSAVNLSPGEHDITFYYMQLGDGTYSGDDRLTISDLSLVCEALPETSVKVWGSDNVTFSELAVTKAASTTVNLANMGSENIKVLSVNGEGAFSGTADYDALYRTFEEIPITIYFIPETSGTMTGTVTVETTAGTVTINCTGEGTQQENVLLTEDFEDSMILWDYYDEDGDGYSWLRTRQENNPYAHQGSCAGISYSIRMDGLTTPVDDYLVSPEFTVPEEGATLSYYVRLYTPELADNYYILAGNGTDLSSYTTVVSETVQDLSDYVLKEVSLNEFAGKTISIAFRHNTESAENVLLIDDILVKANTSSDIDNIVSDNKKIERIEYYTLSGMRISKPAQGLYIVKKVYTDESSTSKKTFVK